MPEYPTLDPDPHAGDERGRCGWPRRAHRLTVGVLNVVYVAVALLGALSAHPAVTFLVVPAAGLLGAVLARVLHRSLHPGIEAPLTNHLPAAVSTGLFAPFVIGMDDLGENSIYVYLAMVLLCAVAAVGWTHALEADGDAPVPHAPPRLTDAEISSLRDLLRALPVDELLHEWRWTRSRLPTDTHVALQVRELLLEEIQRRDPTGFREWLLDGIEHDPEHHIRGDGSDGSAARRPDGPGR